LDRYGSIVLHLNSTFSVWGEKGH